MKRALFVLPFVLTRLLAVEPAAAQDGGRRAMSLDSAAAIRASLVRPPSKPPIDAVDVVGFPFRVALFPVRLAVQTLAGMAGLATLANPPAPVRAVRRMRAWGLKPRIRSIGPRSGPALGFVLSRFSPFLIETGISLVGSQRHRLGVALGDSTSSPGALELAVGFRRDAQENFWGIGGASRETDRSDFRRDKWDAGARGWIRLGQVVGSAELGIERNDVERGTVRWLLGEALPNPRTNRTGCFERGRRGARPDRRDPLGYLLEHGFDVWRRRRPLTDVCVRRHIPCFKEREARRPRSRRPVLA